MSDATTTENPDYALATDLDGTLIPLPDEPLHRWACARLKFLLGRDHIPFMFATGRHFESAHAAIAQYGLPVPQWIVCNVGTDVYERRADGSYKRMEAFHEHLHAFAKGVTTEDVYAAVKDVDGIVLQPQDVQGPFKLSFFADPEKLESLSAELTERVQAKSLQYEVMTSVDPGKSHGLIDLLPNDVHKAHAVMWLADHVGFSPDHVIYAGDSGNDYAALTHGFRAIVVGNASPGLAEKVKTALNEAARLECFYEAEFGATAAVLEGCLNYELFNGEAEALKGFGSRKPAEWHSPIGVSCSSTEVLCNIWAPKCDAECFLKFVEGTEPESEQALVRSDNGYHFKDLKASLGTTYHIELSDGRRLPDPASRFQPEGVQGPSQIVPLPRHSSREWSQAALPKSLWELVIYEVHVGTFTYEGTYAAAAKRLPKLKELGVTAIELMPLAQPSGSRNWGYDGVFLYAPQAAYGTPAELGAFIDEAHRLGLLVIHDVVYNHLGPEGNVLDEFGPYHRDDIQTPWGPALDWTQPAVRDFFLCNALYWLGEVGFDGLRLDAIGTYYDDTAPCFLDELREVVDALGKAQGRKLWLFGESNLYHARNLSARPEGSDLDAIWSDDLAHSLFSVITDQTEHGGRSYRGAADLDQALKRGALFERTGQDQSQRLPDLSP
ncbi:MAG: HAD-IIB family hydrolase, partial [Opitutales bacterium]